MLIPDRYLFVKLILLITSFRLVELILFEDPANGYVRWTGEAGGYKLLEGDEDNPEQVEIIRIKEATNEPTITIFTPGNWDMQVVPEGADWKVILNSKLDFNDFSTPEVFFSVKDSSTSQNFKFKLINIDNKYPSVVAEICKIQENVAVTLADSTCSYLVSDKDGWLNGMTFEIEGNYGEQDLFAFGYKEPVPDTELSANVYLYLQDGKTLDYETNTLFIFNLIAKDKAGHPTIPTDKVQIIVQVEDIPDEPPVWIKFVDVQSFLEEEPQSFSILARDGDYGIDNEINYRIDTTNILITINDRTGVITVGKIDRDVGPTDIIEFTVTAYEALDPSSEVTKTMTFIINDIDDNAPLITMDVASITIEENFAGSLPINIQISNLDIGTNGMYNVYLEDEPTNNFTDAFRVVPINGYQTSVFTIIVSQPDLLDYEDPNWRNIAFKLRSKGDDPSILNDEKLITIDLIDVNDEYPEFLENLYTVAVDENVTQDYELITIHAIDRDQGDVVTHSLVGTMANSILIIDPTTGNIRTKLDQSFDYEKQPEILIEIQAVDQANHKSFAQLTIMVNDINEEIPVISVVKLK